MATPLSETASPSSAQEAQTGQSEQATQTQESAQTTQESPAAQASQAVQVTQETQSDSSAKPSHRDRSHRIRKSAEPRKLVQVPQIVLAPRPPQATQLTYTQHPAQFPQQLIPGHPQQAQHALQVQHPLQGQHPQLGRPPTHVPAHPQYQGQQQARTPPQPQEAQHAPERTQRPEETRTPGPSQGLSQNGAQPVVPPPPPPGGRGESERAAEFYSILGALDPYKLTPVEFIHLLVTAAMTNDEISRALYSMHNARIQNPHTWQPKLPPQIMGPPVQFQYQPPPPDPNRGPQFAHPFAVQAPNFLQHVPAAQRNHPSPIAQPPGPWAGPLPNQLYLPPGPAHSQHIPPQHYIPIQNNPQGVAGSHNGASSIPIPGGGLAPDTSATGPCHANGNRTDPGDGEPPEPKEPACNYTWVVDRAETHLGWTGNWNKYSEIRQHTIGVSVAGKLQKLMQLMEKHMDKHKTFVNRVHILCVMREVLMATLETDSIVGSEARRNAQGYDDAYVTAAEKLTPPQRRRLKALEGGKVIREFQELVDEAKHQNMFPRLEEALAIFDSSEDTRTAD
ncbi:hypothetical protein DL764_010822 [Monosporascus ibericus]|uniref:Uncharacterized protein n=1 Tax=Monosporascus ibericus TaxID=155417 RepID=A0A4Q4SS27_9PEZI|nr:hypothetical protein DL764_010822 [Monosporascus ibericus]